MPFQCALYRNKENRMAIRSYCKDLKPDVVMIDMIRFAPYINALDGLCCPVVLDYDDLLSKRYSRQIGETSGNPLGNYASQATGIVSRLMTNCAARNAILSLESKRIEEAEAWYAKRADAILFVSPKEACELDKKLGTNKCFNATVGVELTDVSISSTEKEYDLGFVGNLNTAANQASLDYICYEILPLLPGLRLRIIGVCPDEVKNRFSSFDQVSFSGRVDSIGVELLKCKVMLAPFVYGSGIKTKVLEAMGIGVPVVTNDLGVEGMSCKPNSEFELGNSPIEIAHCCKTLLANENRRREIALAGKDYVRKNHDWRISIENLGRCLDYAEKSKSPNSCGEGIQ